MPLGAVSSNIIFWFIFQIFVFKISGIVLPMYLVFRIIVAIQEGIHRGYEVSVDNAMITPMLMFKISVQNCPSFLFQ